MNDEVAILFGMMLGDGWLSVSKNSYICGFSGDAKSLEIVKDDLISIFGKIGKAKIFTRPTESIMYNIKGITSSFVCNTRVTKEFIKLGMPVGKRTTQEFLLPEWITNGTIDIKKAFLSGLYSAEGYTPAMQVNDKTVKALGLNISKRYLLKDNFEQLLDQLCKIITELNIKFNLRVEEVYTCDRNLKAIFEFGNSLDNVLNICKALDLKYCINKQQELNILQQYYSKKKDILVYLSNAQTDALIHREVSSKLISLRYCITQSQVENWRRRETGIRIPNNFPTYTEFKQSILSTINPVN